VSPMSLPYHQWYWSLMLPEIRKYCTGWNTETFVGNNPQNNNYGIHMTFSRKWWTDLQLARLIKFIDNPLNQPLIRAIAQRSQIYNGETLAGQKFQLKHKVLIKNKKIVAGTNRYVPVNVKNDNLVELRFFRTTLNTESFLKNLEWFFSFYEWVQTTPFSINAVHYIDWLQHHQLGYGRYSNLYRYLGRETFPCKGVQGGVTNTWRNMFCDIHKRKPLIFNIEPEVIATPEYVLEKDIESCV
jgi:hypothetical protein